MKVLDLFCGAGGASMGIFQAGFEVTGVDIEEQPDYPFEFILENALCVDLSGYDAYFASPPCQEYSVATLQWKTKGYDYPDLINDIRDKLVCTGKPFVIENVVRSPLRKDLLLCGQMFGKDLKYEVRRHRVFEIHGFKVPQIKHETHKGRVGDGRIISVFGHGGGKRYNHASSDLKIWKEAMQVPWMTKRRSVTESIPPYYTEYIFRHLKEFLDGRV